MTVLCAIVAVLVAAGPGFAADTAYEGGARPGTGSTNVATAPPAAPDSDPSAMPRTTAERVRAVRPEAILGVLVGLMLVTGLALAVRMLVGVFRHR